MTPLPIATQNPELEGDHAITTTKLIVDTGIASFIYLILAMQVQFGFPPFYKRILLVPWRGILDAEDERSLKRVIPWLFAIGASMAALAITELVAFFLLFGLLSAWTGVRVRQDLLHTTGGPRPWLSNPVTNRWPMLPFDVWTLSLTLLMFLMIRG